MSNDTLTCVEICAGAGGEALGLSRAGFQHIALIEYEKDYCDILRHNRPDWPVINMDVHEFCGKDYQNVDLLAGGVPCPPFSVAGKQLGQDDDRDLFPQAIRLVAEIKPKAVMFENVRGLLSSTFINYREQIISQITELGYRVQIKLLNASDYQVPQLRPRVVIVGIRNDIECEFTYPLGTTNSIVTVGETIGDLMQERGWSGTNEWIKKADRVAPTIVGGSIKHGGPDLGPIRARQAWAEMGIDGSGIANSAPESDYIGMPKLTPRMIARLQGFPDEWYFGEKKTKACRMIGNAFPPPVAEAVGKEIRRCLLNEQR